jgi:predicted AAA+ superfamily ATPase
VAFHSLIQLAALRTGQVLNISELGRDAKLNSRTASRYLDLMETSFLIKKLTPYLSNRSSRLIKSPKLYFSDSGLACHLSGIEPDGNRNGSFEGSMIETYIAQNLSGIIGAHLPDARIHYWHVQGRHEVDFVIEHKRETIAIEIKSAARWNSHDLSGLKAFQKVTSNCKAAILAYNGSEAVKLEDNIFAIPIGMLLS